MRISSITLLNFRSYEEREFSFDEDTTVIVGPNGAGKTNLLEAIYVLLAGKSFRDGDEDLVRHGKEWWRIDGIFGENNRQIRYNPKDTKTKQLVVDGANKGRFTYKHQLPFVLFEPDDLMMIHGTPGTRRRYLDGILVKVSPGYRTLLSRYERALLQRNNLLKKQLPLTALRDSIFVWDIAISDLGSVIQKERINLISQINESISDIYSTIAGKQHIVKMEYSCRNEGDSQKFASLLAKDLEKDRLRGFTGVGPHRDDIILMIDGYDAKQTASRGEVRTLVLALKEIEARLVSYYYGVSPIVLMDDVFSELDQKRQDMVAGKMAGGQKIITTNTHTRAAGIIELT